MAKEDVQKQANLYHADLVKQYGPNPRDISWQQELDERPDFQHERVSYILENSQNFLYMIANQLLKGKTEFIKNLTWGSLEGTGLDKRDLVGIANQHLLERFSRYNPEHSVFTFMGLRAKASMYRGGIDSTGLVHVPAYMLSEIRGRGYEGIYEKLMERQQGPSCESAANIASLLRANQFGHIDIHSRREEDNKTIEEIELIDECAEERIEENLRKQYIDRDVNDVVGHLTHRQQEMIEEVFWKGRHIKEVAQEWGIHSWRANMVLHQALRRMRWKGYNFLGEL